MSKLVFLLEEPSMQEALNGLLPRLIPKSIQWQCVPHQGKSDLWASIPRKLRAWREPGVRFVVLYDNDGRDCLELKRELAHLCQSAGRPDTLVRIVCQELESWFLGDPDAIVAAGLSDGKFRQRSAYRNDPDRNSKPSRSLKRLVPQYQKMSGARAIAPFLRLEGNRSTSFGVFISGIRKLVEEIG